ncbi:MAG: hypothetical protein Ct9H300mP11_19690 [Chloroflexota bacterium]|nr:MAG: hypothetical protein Ct9H300mP11_19690 [Chloroflexota bacterium]
MGVTLTTHSVHFDKEAETATLEFGNTIEPGEARLEMAFSGELNDKLIGFYRSEYTSQDGETRYLATTQFEATDARRAFPCWDEPAKKATFEVTLVFADEYQAVSNTPVVEETVPGTGLKSIRFAETPVMSTYLLAFVVGNLTSIEEMAPGGTLVGVWTTPGKENQANFALETSVKLLGYFNEYFGIPYPLAKLDHIAYLTLPQEPWRTGVPSRIAKLPCWSTQTTHQRAPDRGWPKSLLMKWPTCGSGTWLPWNGGTTCG